MQFKDGKYSSGYVRHITWRTGKPWAGVLIYEDDTGEMQTITKMFDPAIKSNKAANEALREWHDELVRADKEAAAHPGPLDVDGLTVAEYVQRYIDDAAARGEVERSTVADYRNSLKRLTQGEAPIADVMLPDLKRADVQRWVDGLTTNYSPAVVCKSHRLLRQVMRFAVSMDDLPKDPTLGVKLPKRSGEKINALDDAGRARLIVALDGMDPTSFKTGVALALYTGMRQGEICGLRWKNVDLDRRTLWVREAIGNAAGMTYTKEPKTGGSLREIPLYSGLVEILEARRTYMMRQCADAGIIFQKDMYVIGFVDDPEHYYSPHTLGHEWMSFAKAYGLKGMTGERVTFHDLRHTFATAAIAGGVDVKTVSSMLGHADASVTLRIYTAADPKAKRAAIEDIGREIEKEAPTKVIEFTNAAEGGNGQ